MDRTLPISLLAAPFLLAGCQQQIETSRPVVSPEAKIVGEPVSCVTLAQIRETKIRDDWTIDFMRDGKRGWRNTLTSRCPGLRSAGAITYRTSAGRLCRVDTVNVLETVGNRPQRGAACGLGQFTPVEFDK